ncbi:alkaline phosphatase D family protein [Sphingomonas nostoxanthinifaciens]|uniref:alkaline phosphatase D family protein n=1 Tax=Sphingomonas nostoxanthinifaciens TaxID=2872652 RepID=UPI001CC1D7CE|nr:alkaline phosphatase D family protein [Sphingomonas nostoxanthinifaciens]UAK24540.1 alkaline phosphatase D family protein [Sphingomonas nostoxanthinifaciens]
MIDRRAMLVGGLAAPALLTFGLGAAPSANPFTLGVASGDPAPDGMVLWTRLAPEPLAGDGGMPPRPVRVRWEVAEDEHFARVVRAGEATADPAWGHSVHVEPRGLRPARVYWYRFIADGVASPVGRTRTAPAAGAAVDRLRLCFGSCQKYEVGHYAAWRHVVAEDPDLVLFLGDYIYENGPEPKSLRPHPTPEPFDVAGYRARYATYKLDPLLQAAHHAAPWLLTWDDHEVANDYQDTLDEKNSDPVAFLRRRAAAYQVYWEHQPLRASARPNGPAALLYRTIDWGGLAQFQILDDRQFRGPRACQPPELLARHVQYEVLVQDCADLTQYRTMLGATQERWLDAALGRTRAQWNLLSQQTLMTTLHRVDPTHADRGPSTVSTDTWSGYPAARDRIFRRWVEAKTPNPLALGGDIHAFAAADIRDPAHRDAPPIGTELVGGSITSLFHDTALKQEAKASDIAFAENEVHGYGRVDLTHGRADVAFRGLADATREDTSVSDLIRYTVEAGRPGLQKA